jgi:hypothetical protein
VKKDLRRAGFVSLTLGAFGCGEPAQPDALRPKDLFTSDTTPADSRKGEGWRKFLSAAELNRAWAPSPQSPWRPYYKPTLIAAVAAVESAAMPVVNVGMTPAMAEAQRYADSFLPAGTAVIVDLIGEQSVVWAATLRRKGMVPVVMINNWPHQSGILRLERPLGALLYYADEVSRTPLQADDPPVFILERSRLSQKGLNPTSEQFDNRYFHAQTDFPTASTFRSRGINQIVYINPQGVTPGSEEDDLNEYFVELSKAGLQLVYVQSKTSRADSAVVTPEPRTTIFTKPAMAEYVSSPQYRPHYTHSYYHYNTWHSSYWTRSSGAWGGDRPSSGWSSGSGTHASGGGSHSSGGYSS